MNRYNPDVCFNCEHWTKTGGQPVRFIRPGMQRKIEKVVGKLFVNPFGTCRLDLFATEDVNWLETCEHHKRREHAEEKNNGIKTKR